jgi:hypothetical protein
VDVLSLDQESEMYLLSQNNLEIVLTGFPQNLDRFDSVKWKKIKKPMQVSELFQEIFS